MNTTAENTAKKEQNLKQIIKKLNSYMSQPSVKSMPSDNGRFNADDLKNTWEDEQAIADFRW